MKPISETAFCCCGIRMQDAQSSMPICDDELAEVFMDERGLKIFSGFKAHRRASENIVVRHRVIDDALLDILQRHPATTIVSLGTGFETRPYRLSGGQWIEVDEPQVIAYKNERLPISHCLNPLQRLGVDFETESIREKLLPYASDNNIVIVVEGVFLYLNDDQVRTLLNDLRSLFPNHVLIGDLLTRAFVERYSRRFDKKINALGAYYQMSDNPLVVFQQSQYQISGKTSINVRNAELRGYRLQRWLFRYFFKTVVEGYNVYVLETGNAHALLNPKAAA